MMKRDNTKARFKLRSVFLFVNLTVLFLPLLGVIFFRFYENQLVKQTESELISQAAVFAAIYKENLKSELGENWDQYGLLLHEEGVRIAEVSEDYYTPVEPQIDLFAGDILPPRPDGMEVEFPESEPDVMIADNSGNEADNEPNDGREEEQPTVIAREENLPDEEDVAEDEMVIAGVIETDQAVVPAPAAAPAPDPIEEDKLETVRQGDGLSYQFGPKPEEEEPTEHSPVPGHFARGMNLGTPTVQPKTQQKRPPRQIASGGMSGRDDADVITVVGSRVKGRTALDSRVPVDVIQVGELAQTPSLNLADAAQPANNDELRDIEDNATDIVEVKPEIIEDEVARRVGEDMLPIIVDAQKTTLSGIKILDYKGIAVAGRNEIGLNFSLLTEIQTALKGEYTSLMRARTYYDPPPAIASISRGTGIRLFIAFPITEGDRLWGVAYLSRTPQNILKHIYNNKEKMTLIGLSLLSLTLALALLTSYTISKPMNRLIARVKRFTDGEQEAIEPMTSPGVTEIEQLSESFSNMATALNDRAHYIREFAMSVSHEFKTPITSIQGSAELLLEHVDDMTPEKKQKFLANIITDSDRLKRLINRLLELARADNFKPGNDTASLMASLTDLRDRYRDLNVEIDISGAEENETLIAKEHLETILTNLFDNAMQHDAKHVSVVTESQYGFVSLIISDDGSGISDANSVKIFDSFFTTKRENGGTGLGLGIVSSLLNAHNGAIELIKTKSGATFKITLPVTIDKVG